MKNIWIVLRLIDDLNGGRVTFPQDAEALLLRLLASKVAGEKSEAILILDSLSCNSSPLFGGIWALPPLSLGILKFHNDASYWGVFHSLSWVLFRPFQSENSHPSVLYYFVDNFLPTIFSIPLFWNSF